MLRSALSKTAVKDYQMLAGAGTLVLASTKLLGGLALKTIRALLAVTFINFGVRRPKEGLFAIYAASCLLYKGARGIPSNSKIAF